MTHSGLENMVTSGTFFQKPPNLGILRVKELGKVRANESCFFKIADGSGIFSKTLKGSGIFAPYRGTPF